MSKKKAQLFQNTQEAVAFGENATLEDMTVLVRRLVQIMVGKITDVSKAQKFRLTPNLPSDQKNRETKN